MFITLEGIDGAGKTSNINTIINFLKHKKIPFVSTREPGGTELGEKLRSILLNRKTKYAVPKAELLLFIADRIQNIKKVIVPALKENKVVICDRYIDSTIAYQVYGRTNSEKKDTTLVEYLHTSLCDGLMPDLTILLDVDPLIALSRVWEGESHDGSSIFDQENVDFFNQVRSGYLTIAKENPNRFVIIDASQPSYQVNSNILDCIRKITTGRE